MMTTANDWLCLHPHAMTENQTTLSLDNRGLAYGDGFFTTMGVIEGEIQWAEYHVQRLHTHAQALQLQLPSTATWLSIHTHAKQLQQGMIKVIITRTKQATRGYGFTPDRSGHGCEIWLKATAMTMPMDTMTSLSLPHTQPICCQPPVTAVCLQSQLACLPPTLAGLKSLNRLDNVLASGELHSLNAKQIDATPNNLYGEGLLRDMSGNWIEGTMSNVFYQLSTSHRKFIHSPHHSHYLLSGQWYTPPMTQSGVAGVMRQVIIDGLANGNNPVIIRPLATMDLAHVSQLFFCNAVRGVMPVSALTLLSGEAVEFG